MALKLAMCRMALHLRIKGRKLATEMIGLLKNWDNSQDLPSFQRPQVLPVACCSSASWEQCRLRVLARGHFISVLRLSHRPVDNLCVCVCFLFFVLLLLIYFSVVNCFR